MGIVATHPIAAPVAAPPRPPSVVFAAGIGLHAAMPERPEMSTSALITFITTSHWLSWLSSAGLDPVPGRFQARKILALITNDLTFRPFGDRANRMQTRF
jgi:hypothetical protein